MLKYTRVPRKGQTKGVKVTGVMTVLNVINTNNMNLSTKKNCVSGRGGRQNGAVQGGNQLVGK